MSDLNHSLPREKAKVGACAFQIRGWVAWTPGRETEADWCRWAQAPLKTHSRFASTDVPAPAVLRRRVTPLGQAALRAAWQLPDVATARLVCASRHGEYARTLSILDALAAGQEVSPADFTLSVHHALIGLLSIATKNRNGHTAIAAGSDSFAFGLMEAAACLAAQPEQPVTFLYYDEGLPAPYGDFHRADEPPLVVALALAAPDDHDAVTVETAANDHAGDFTPSQALDFLRFIMTGEQQQTSRGERLTWQWRRYASAA